MAASTLALHSDFHLNLQKIYTVINIQNFVRYNYNSTELRLEKRWGHKTAAKTPRQHHLKRGLGNKKHMVPETRGEDRTSVGVGAGAQRFLQQQ